MRHLQLVAAVAEHGSLTKAGSHLHLTQSALSHQLREIESRLGTAIFLRLKKRMIPTVAGEHLLLSARRVLDQVIETERTIRDLALERQGVLRVSTECYTCYHWLPRLVRVFHETFPRVEIRIDVDSTPHPLPMLLDGQIDLALLFSDVRDRRLVLTPIFDNELVVILGPGHRLATRPYLRPADLIYEQFFLYSPKEESYVFKRILAPAGVPGTAIHHVMLTEAIVEFVKANLGISVLARWAVQPHVDAGAIAAVPLTRAGFRQTWKAATLKPLATVAYVKEFVRLLSTNAVPAADRAKRRLAR